jgi:predicted XRE-type DNA-binding protein
MEHKHTAHGGTWEEHKAELLAKGLVTEEALHESKMRAMLMGEIVKARKEKNISQQKLEELSGVRQPVIARMENGTSVPKIDTVIKVLTPLGKTLAVVPIKHL